MCDGHSPDSPAQDAAACTHEVTGMDSGTLVLKREHQRCRRCFMVTLNTIKSFLLEWSNSPTETDLNV